MRRILSVLLCLVLVVGAMPAMAFAAETPLAEGLYWRGTAREPNEETFFKIFADQSMALTKEPITGYPGEQTGCVQIVYCDGAGGEKVLSCADLTFTERDSYYQANDPVPMFVKEGEVLVDIVRIKIGDTGLVKYEKDGKEFSLSIISNIPDFGIYSGMEGKEEDILSAWDYDGTNKTIYLVAKDGLYLKDAWIDAEEAEWMGLEVGTPVDHKAVALTITDIDSFRGGFDLYYSYTEDASGSGTVLEGQIFVMLFDVRPLFFRWVDEDDNHYTVQENEDRTMWASPGEERLVQFVYIEDDGTWKPLKFTDLTFDGCSAEVAKDRDGNVIDETYISLSFDDFGEASVSYKTESVPVYINLPDFGFYTIERPTVEDEHDETWNDQLKAAFVKEWRFNGSESVLYVRGTYNASFAWITKIEQESGHEIDTEILEDGKLVKVTLKETDPDMPWLNLKLTCERRDDEGNVIISGETQWANIRICETRTKVTLHAKEGEIEATVDKDSGETLFTGPLTQESPALLASFDDEGRFLGLKVAAKDGDKAQAEAGADSVKLFWIDKDFAPKSGDASVELLK